MPPSNPIIQYFILYFIPTIYFLMRIIEICVNKRQFPKIRGWDLVGIFYLWFGGIIREFMSWALPMSWIASHQLLNGYRLGTFWGSVVGILATSLGWYLWHRTIHRVNFLWRAIHQMHHSAQRVDIPSSLFVHPLEIFFQGLVDIVITIFILGLNFEATIISIYFHAFNELFHHMNIGTPTWLAWFIQRPEAHCIHHQRGVHAYNYSNFPIWDMLGGTFKNPESFDGEVGFEPQASKRILAMLVGVDVHAPREKNS